MAPATTTTTTMATTTTSNSNSNSISRLEEEEVRVPVIVEARFANWEDVQTQLVLVPANNEDEGCRGAKVVGVVDDESTAAATAAAANNNIIGQDSVVVRVNDVAVRQDMDFTTILQILRDATPPLILQFEQQEQPPSSSTDQATEADPTEKPQQQTTEAHNHHPLNIDDAAEEEKKNVDEEEDADVVAITRQQKDDKPSSWNRKEEEPQQQPHSLVSFPAFQEEKKEDDHHNSIVTSASSSSATTASSSSDTTADSSVNSSDQQENKDKEERGTKQQPHSPLSDVATTDRDTMAATSHASSDQTNESSSDDCPASETKAEEDGKEKPTTPQTPPVATTPTATNNSSGGGFRNFSAWTSRVSAVVAQSAAAAAKQMSPTPTPSPPARSREGGNKDHVDNKPPPYTLFVQSATGAFLPVSKSTEVHNSSLLVVRQSTQVSAEQERNSESSSLSFQWYKSTTSGGNMTTAADGENNNNDDDNRTTKNNNQEEEHCWEKLEGATGAAFQPTTTEIGYRIQCRMHILVEQSHDVDNSDDGDENRSSQTKEQEYMICGTTGIVHAALNLFNGARQALVRGAQFANLQGRGHAEGRTFRIQIGLSYRDKKNKRNKTTTSAISIFQVSGSTAEPIHSPDEPLLCISARSDHGHAKNLALVFTENLPKSASMVQALCDDQNCLLLQAPNRLARESMLLAIGIANYQGKPVDLDASTMLYPPSLAARAGPSSMLDNDTVSSSSSSSTEEEAGSTSPPPPDHPPLPPLPPTAAHVRSTSLDSSPSRTAAKDSARVLDLQHELKLLREKLQRKDKIISELQRQMTHSDEACVKLEHQLKNQKSEMDKCQITNTNIQQSLKTAEKQIGTHSQLVNKLQADAQLKVGKMESEMHMQREKIASLEKANRTLQNEKDVLSAAVEARDSKLDRMAHLQTSFDELSAQISEQDEFQQKVDEANRRYTDSHRECERILKAKKDCEHELSQARDRNSVLEKQLETEMAKEASQQSELEMELMKIQKLKAERNSYKQKCDSIAKEMARVCRHGRTIREVEKILADDVTRREEVALLRDQKRKALEDLEHFRTAYENSLSVQMLAGMDHDSGKLLERNAELERLLSELTEYVQAKEMQLETMKQVNDALQSEIRDLAKASMSKNDI